MRLALRRPPTEVRFGQITRGTGHVYIIWDLKAGVGISTFSDKYWFVGDLVQFETRANGVVIHDRQVSEEDLPKGIIPLIPVPTNYPPAPPPNDAQSSEVVPPKRVHKGARR
jgi:hypothetical protein